MPRLSDQICSIGNAEPQAKYHGEQQEVAKWDTARAELVKIMQLNYIRVFNRLVHELKSSDLPVPKSSELLSEPCSLSEILNLIYFLETFKKSIGFSSASVPARYAEGRRLLPFPAPCFLL